MTASCLSCHKSSPQGDVLVCRFHDHAQVRPGYVCVAWAQKGMQGASYGFPVLTERRKSQQAYEGEDLRGTHGVRVLHHDDIGAA